jgi:mannose-6-phosphate isomerase-like protein (cupin superfamily)
MYTAADPRSRLAAGAAPAAAGPSRFADASYARFYEGPPQETVAGTRHWYARGQNFVIAYTEAAPGAVLERQGQADEYVVLLPDAGAGATVTAGGETVEVPGRTLVFVPPGDSRVVMRDGGRVVRMLTTRAEDLAAKCSNAAAYAEPHPDIPPLQAWPDPPAGFRIRSYSIDQPEQEGRFGQIWRCTTFMINVFPPAPPRPLNKLSPHHHDTFEQCSLALAGEFMHHLRWPWTTDMADWRADEHEHCAAGSIVVIPPKVIHTTAAAASANNVLVDIFSPPRVDFSKMAGWVLNADDYPMPEAD